MMPIPSRTHRLPPTILLPPHHLPMPCCLPSAPARPCTHVTCPLHTYMRVQCSCVAQDSPASVHSAGTLKGGTGRGGCQQKPQSCIRGECSCPYLHTDVSVQCSHVAQDSPVSVHGARTLKGMGLASSDCDRMSQVCKVHNSIAVYAVMVSLLYSF